MNDLNRAANEAANDSVSLFVTTAALPLNSKPSSMGGGKGLEPSTLDSMWSSMTACSVMELPGNEGESIRLPSQAQTFEDDSYVTSLDKAIDGLILVCATSQDTYYVHCVDVTVRCNPC